jgi:hypothetical protein
VYCTIALGAFFWRGGGEEEKRDIVHGHDSRYEMTKEHDDIVV